MNAAVVIKKLIMKTKTHKDAHAGTVIAGNSKNKITKDMKIIEIIDKNPEAAELFFESGLGCAGCAFSGFETLEQGALGHGMTEEDVDILLKRLNS